MRAFRDHAQSTTDGHGNPTLAVPEGWRSLDDLPEEAVEVFGLLSSGSVVFAEWWGPVPEELWGPSGCDGSGWAWNGAGLTGFGAGQELIAWRPRDGAGHGTASTSDQQCSFRDEPNLSGRPTHD